MSYSIQKTIKLVSESIQASVIAPEAYRQQSLIYFDSGNTSTDVIVDFKKFSTSVNMNITANVNTPTTIPTCVLVIPTANTRTYRGYTFANSVPNVTTSILPTTDFCKPIAYANVVGCIQYNTANVGVFTIHGNINQVKLPVGNSTIQSCIEYQQYL